MSSNFAIVGAGAIGAWIIDELLNYKDSGAVNTLKVLSRSVSLRLLTLFVLLASVTSPEYLADGISLDRKRSGLPTLSGSPGVLSLSKSTTTTKLPFVRSSGA